MRPAAFLSDLFSEWMSIRCGLIYRGSTASSIPKIIATKVGERLAVFAVAPTGHE